MGGTNLGVALAFFCGCCWALMGIAGKGLSLESTNMISVALVRLMVLLCGSFFYFLLFNRKAFVPPKGKMIYLWLSGSVTIFFIYVGYFVSLRYISVPMAVALLYTYPLWTTLTSGLVLKEYPSRIQIISSLMVVLGAVVVIGPGELMARSFSVKGVLWVLMSAVGMALYSLFGRLSSRGEEMDQSTFFFYFHFLGLFSIVAVNYFSGGLADLASFSASQWRGALFMGFVGNLMGYVLYFVSLRHISASLGSAVATVEVVVTIVLAAILFKEVPSLNEIIGGVMIVSAIFIGMVGEKRSSLSYLKE